MHAGLLPVALTVAVPALEFTVHSHLIAFAAEESRLTGRVVDLASFASQVQ